MQTFPIQIGPEDAIEEISNVNRKLVQGIEMLSTFSEEDVQVGVSEREAVYEEDKLVLYRFKPLVEETFPIPVLISYALVNRPLMTDLQEDRSMVRNLLKLGLDIYIIDWGYPSREDRWLTLDDYINGYIDNCVDFIRERHGLDQINLLGICQGGTFSLCYTSLHPEKIKNLIVMVTPVDFQAGKDSLLNRWSGCTVGAEAMDVDSLVDAMGNIPADLMNVSFLMLQPFQLNFQKYIDMIDIMDDEKRLKNFVRMENWIFDSPDQAGETFRQFVKDFFQTNKLIKGEVYIGDDRVDLGNITMPVLNLYAAKDHMVPPPSSEALEKYVGSKDYTATSFPVGHIGMYVSGKVQKSLPPVINDWLRERG